MMRNTFKTFVLLAGLGGFLVLFGSVVGGPTGMVIGLLFGVVLVGSSYWFSDRLAVRSARAVPVTEGELGWLRLEVVTLAERAGMQPPRLFVSPDAQPNAFATGRNERNAVVCDASIVYVTVSTDGKPIPVPDQWRTLFSPWEEAETPKKS